MVYCDAKKEKVYHTGIASKVSIVENLLKLKEVKVKSNKKEHGVCVF